MIRRTTLILVFIFVAIRASAQPPPTGQVHGRVSDETGGVLPGVVVALYSKTSPPSETVTDTSGSSDHSSDDTAQRNRQLLKVVPRRIPCGCFER